MAKNVEEMIRKIIVANCDSQRTDIGLTENLQELGINSLNFMKIVISLEKEFGIEIEDENLIFEIFQTLQSIIDYVEKRISN